MMYLIFFILLPGSVLCDYVTVPSTSEAQCAKISFMHYQNVVIFDRVNNLCLVTSVPVPGPVQVNIRAFIPDKTNKVLLFKVTHRYGQTAIGLYRDTSAYNDTFVNWKNDTSVTWYKSSLMKDLTRFKYMIVEITDSSSVVLAWLKFKVAITDTMESWFNKNSLNDSYPWNVNDIKAVRYTTFSIAGLSTFGYRTFYIENHDNGCETNFGIIAVYDRPDYCSYVTGTVTGYVDFPPPIISFHNTAAASNNFAYFTYANNLRIIGVLNHDYKFYNGV